MVRFIIYQNWKIFLIILVIYIPIWLDLLLQSKNQYLLKVLNLHSNMVRFIIDVNKYSVDYKLKFTFQYGQIYYAVYVDRMPRSMFIYIPIWLDLLCVFLIQKNIQSNYLHSNMVRFIIDIIQQLFYFKIVFTFQYGQIYYSLIIFVKSLILQIYIPIWLDLLFFNNLCKIFDFTNLHSNMVRFIIEIGYDYVVSYLKFTFQYGQIYYLQVIYIY